jgi:hypothetical protein
MVKKFSDFFAPFTNEHCSLYFTQSVIVLVYQNYFSSIVLIGNLYQLKLFHIPFCVMCNCDVCIVHLDCYKFPQTVVPHKTLILTL